MSAMPAWGKTQDDTQIWELVAFIQQLQQMTPETYALLSRADGPLDKTSSR
jgi:mono/diheme cytochrome c family protein